MTSSVVSVPTRGAVTLDAFLRFPSVSIARFNGKRCGRRDVSHSIAVVWQSLLSPRSFFVEVTRSSRWHIVHPSLKSPLCIPFRCIARGSMTSA